MAKAVTERLGRAWWAGELPRSDAAAGVPRPRVVRWYLHLAGFLLALRHWSLAIGPTYPGEQQYLVTAERLEAGLRYDLALARYADASAVAPTDPGPTV